MTLHCKEFLPVYICTNKENTKLGKTNNENGGTNKNADYTMIMIFPRGFSFRENCVCEQNPVRQTALYTKKDGEHCSTSHKNFFQQQEG